MSWHQIEGIPLGQNPNPVLITGTIATTNFVYSSPKASYQNAVLAGLATTNFTFNVTGGKIGKLIRIWVSSTGLSSFDVKTNGVTVATLVANGDSESLTPTYGLIYTPLATNFVIAVTNNSPLSQNVSVYLEWDET